MPLVIRRTDSHLVVELDDVVDPAVGSAVEQALERVVRTAEVRVVLVDVRTPLLTSTALHILSRVQRGARARGLVLCVVAREPLARRVLRTAGLSRTLRVSATTSGALRLSRSCSTGHPARADDPGELPPGPPDRPSAGHGPR